MKYILNGKVSLGLVLVAMATCAHAQEQLTKKLFMQTQRISISLPESAVAATEKFSVTLTEEEQMATAHDADGANMDNVWKNVDMAEVRVVAQRKVMRLTENGGKVRLSFRIQVPKVLIDDKWRVTLTPKVMANDSTYSLQSVLLKGKDFKALQRHEHDEYEKFVVRLVEPEKYNKTFINQPGIDQDMTGQQQLYYNVANAERARMVEYEQWKLRWEQTRMKDNIDILARRNSLRQDLQRQAIVRRYDKYMKGLDSTNISGYYYSLYEQEVKEKKKYRFRGEMTLKDVPARFRDIYLSGRSIEDLQNFNVTAADSLLFASTQFRQKELSRNHYLLNNTNEVKTNMIHFPYEENVKEEFVADPTMNYAYTYTADFPIAEGLKSLKVVLDGRILAIDRSVWTNPQIDMLTFNIASLAEYADVHMLPKTGDVVAYQAGVRALKDRRYKQALEILSDYSDMNAAIAYACNGHTQQAVAILSGVPPFPLVNYLKAILYTRIAKYQEAADCLLLACNEDKKYAFRAENDTDLAELFPRFYGLEQELKRIQEKK